MKKVINLKNSVYDANAIVIEVYYTKGGMNYSTYEIERKGYYLSVAPVWQCSGFLTKSSFSGKKVLLKEVARNSAKAEEEAEKIAESKIADLVKYVCNSNDIPVPNEIA